MAVSKSTAKQALSSANLHVSGLTIVSAADHAGYCTFASALGATDHIRVRQGDGPFTVFAPSDAAFEKFSAAARDQLFDGDRELLQLVMGYHFTPGKGVAARFAGKRIRARMHSGGELVVDGRSGLRVNGANLVEPDIAASNGVIHGVDAVLWPSEGAGAA